MDTETSLSIPEQLHVESPGIGPGGITIHAAPKDPVALPRVRWVFAPGRPGAPALGGDCGVRRTAGGGAGYRTPSTSDPRASTRSRKASTRSHISSEEARSYSGRSGSENRCPEPG